MIFFSDINECYEGLNRCEHNCKNTEGSYVCSCKTGYSLKIDGYSCDVSHLSHSNCSSFTSQLYVTQISVNVMITWISVNKTASIQRASTIAPVKMATGLEMMATHVMV